MTRRGEAVLTHGTLNGYINHACRCDDCRTASTDFNRGARERRVARMAADPTLAEHGRASTYQNWGCRCRPCTDAHSAVRRDYWHRAKSGDVGPFGGPKRPLKHGSAYAYQQKSCRCEECRAWSRAKVIARKRKED